MARAAPKSGVEWAKDASGRAWMHPVAARFRGALAASLGLILALALASYHAGDPSLDAAADGAPANLLGAAGASTADVLMQSLGLTAWAGAAMLLTLGLARAAEAEPDATRIKLRWRALAGVGAVIFLAGGLSGVAPPAIWPLACG